MGSIFKPCCIQNHVKMNSVMKSLCVPVYSYLGHFKKGIDTLGTQSVILKADNFHDFLFAFLCTEPL